MVISALYPPYAFGGAEDCARSFAEWAASDGHDVRVLMAAREVGDGGSVRNVNGVAVEMLDTPHIYPVGLVDKAPSWQKPIWHVQDHFIDQVGRAIADRIVTFVPDIVMIHYVQGFGYRTLTHLARCAVPTAFVLHDLGLACMRMSMFRDGHDCVDRCTSCKISGAFKNRLVKKLGSSAPLGFISPSVAMLDALDQFIPVKSYPHARLLNTKAYPGSDREHTPSDTLRLLYAGKLDGPKGVEVLFEAINQLARDRSVSLTVAGAGPLEEPLLKRYRDAPWLRFLGFVSQKTLADEMAVADMLCVPSLWKENSPGVVIHALSMGLPVAATDRGGLGELVRDGYNGILLQKHTVADWVDRLGAITIDPALLVRLRQNTIVGRTGFEKGAIGRQTIAFLDNLIKMRNV